jgi:hypothetical protein
MTATAIVEPAHGPTKTGSPLLDQLWHAARSRGDSEPTADVFAAWARRFILFHDKRHPGEMGLLRGQRTSAGFRPAGTRRRNVDSERACSHDWLTGTLSLFRRHRRFLRNALDHVGHREGRPKSHCHNDQ